MTRARLPALGYAYVALALPALLLGRDHPHATAALLTGAAFAYLWFLATLRAQLIRFDPDGFFAGAADDFADVPLRLDDEGFYRDCATALRAVKRGEVVTYGELAALAGRPGAARAAGTFCARCELAPFLPVHRVVAANGIGSWGSHGILYKRRLLELEGVAL